MSLKSIFLEIEIFKIHTINIYTGGSYNWFMREEIIFEELGEKERILLLRANDFDVDKEGYVLNSSGNRIQSKENPKKFIKAKFACLIPGSLEVIDGTPIAISEFLRKEESKKDKDNNL